MRVCLAVDGKLADEGELQRSVETIYGWDEEGSPATQRSAMHKSSQPEPLEGIESKGLPTERRAGQGCLGVRNTGPEQRMHFKYGIAVRLASFWADLWADSH